MVHYNDYFKKGNNLQSTWRRSYLHPWSSPPQKIALNTPLQTVADTVSMGSDVTAVSMYNSPEHTN